MSFWSAPPPPETHFGGGGQKMSKNHPLWGGGVKNHESFGFFDFEPKKCFQLPDSIEFMWSGLGRALLSAFLETLLTPWYLVQVGML